MDLADAHVRALSYLRRGGESLALNLGTGHGHSVRAVISTVESVGGCRAPTRELPRREGDPPVLVADARRARDVLDWRLRHSVLVNIVRDAWRWQTRPQRAGRRDLASATAIVNA